MADPCPQSPEIAVEVLPEPNSRAEMEEDKGLYFDRGAQEVWLCAQTDELLVTECKGVTHSFRCNDITKVSGRVGAAMNP